ncbi:carbamoyl-phosphate synthase (glutamine-hydrolyzing) large subunit [candidate division KSB1 bacterium]|nr:carbamoyl-phosphate synthase (glutamine-hydrolyzing) large subunit [candidate division KSB1 bacterium]RQW01072.1 MAG: carbamoyl-phosphate synthase (glutamine-hydrolyzing) large subunit [candidate division KSB1 bacterium]
MNNLPDKVIILGSSALKIGEAGEFDYSGSQAIKALKEEGVNTILMNPNIATIQTSDHLADQVYFLPVTPYFVEQVIQKEKPDGILLGFGGQTALNCGLELEKSGVLARYGVRVLGTPVDAILNTEDRNLFIAKLNQINVKTARSFAVTGVTEAIQKAGEIGFPVMIRIAFALGGLGSGLCRNEQEVRELAQKALSYTNQILIEEYLLGWKEVEYEIVRDQYDNCLSVCNMENFDPMGIHTGESIVVAPSQTLSNSEYHKLREIAIRTVRHMGIIGECNIQYALDPYSEDYRVIEINARLSRSSALASKATGYPLAHVAAKLALGYSLTEVANSITKVTKASFEPALDYLVVKIPRWDLKKFKQVSKRIGSGMKSVGEIMAIGRKFEEALQKGLRMLEIGASGLVLNKQFGVADIKKELAEPTDQRIFAIPAAIKAGLTVDEIHDLTHIDKWFLFKIKNIVDIEKWLSRVGEQRCPKDLLEDAKQHGFSDEQISRVLETTEAQVRELRQAYGLTPKVKQIDTLAAEYPAQTNYLYLTYNGTEDDLGFLERNSVMVLGGGAYRIGSSVEFDWCCVNSVMALKELNYQTIMVNYNPETVSTDYDECDKLYFDELSYETVLDIYEKEKPIGVIVSMGGQIPNNLALKLDKAGVKLLGTSARSIDNAEDRHKFSKLLDELGIDQPEWKELSSVQDAIQFARDVGYPVLVRPSYVLSGAAMSVASTNAELEKFLTKASDISSDYPVVISKFIENAKEIEIDAVAQEGELLVYAISEHVENAGVHSGDATMVLPPQRTYLETTRRIKKIARQLARALKINGPFNMQFVAKGNAVKVIELNLRASRSFPFVSKIFKVNFIDIATRVIMGHHVPKIDRSVFDLEYVGVKAPQFSFTRLIGADPTLGVEMASTGEVGCLGDDFEEAFLKALLSVGYKLPVKNILLSTGPIESKAEFLHSTRLLEKMGMNFYATGGTAKFMQANDLPVTKLNWPLSNKEPNVNDYLENGKIDLVINIPKNYQEEELTNDYIIRRKAVDFAIPLFTNLQLARRFVEAISHKSIKDLQIKSWKEHV